MSEHAHDHDHDAPHGPHDHVMPVSTLLIVFVALMLFMLVVPEFTFFAQPLFSLFSRKYEYEADRYAARNADPKELIHALVKLYHDNSATLTPDPLHSAYYDSHPPAAMRIARLRTT